MHIEYRKEARNVVVSHDNPQKSIPFDCGTVYHIIVFKAIDDKQGGFEDPLHYLNRLIQSRSPAEQLGLLNWYESTHELLYNTMSYALEESIPPYLHALMHLPGFTPEDVRQWTINNVTVPDVIMRSYQEDIHGTYSREKTYVWSEYIDLAVATLYSKLYLPVMGEYMRRLNIQYKVSGGTEVYSAYTANAPMFKTHVELTMFNLLSPMLEAVPGINRLLEFITVSINKGNTNLEEIVIDKQVSADDLPLYVLAIVFTRKMVSSAMFGSTVNHLASRLSTTIRNIISPISRVKIALSNEGISKEGGDDVKSVFDDTHAQYPLSVGQVTILHYTTSDEYLLPLVGHLFNHHEYRYLVSVMQQGTPYLTLIHVSAITCVMGNVFNPIILTHCNMETMVRLIAMTYLIIKHRFPLVAQVLIGFPLLDDHREAITDHTQLTKLNSASIALLSQNYPLQTRKGALLIARHIEAVQQSVQYVWVHPEVVTDTVKLYGDTITLPADFLQHYARFMCESPLMLVPSIPDGF